MLEVTRNHALSPVSALPQRPISGDTFNIVPGSHLWFLGLRNVIFPLKGHFVSARNHSFPFTVALSEGIGEVTESLQQYGCAGLKACTQLTFENIPTVGSTFPNSGCFSSFSFLTVTKMGSFSISVQVNTAEVLR